MFIFHKAIHNFNTDTVPSTPLANIRFQNQRIGDFAFRILDRIADLSSYKSLFHLLRMYSVCSTHSNIMYGLSAYPVKDNLPAKDFVVVTLSFLPLFALQDLDLTKVRTKNILNGITIHYVGNVPVFVSIGFNSSEIGDLNLFHDHFSLKYMYYSLGFIFKSVLNRRVKVLSLDDVKERHSRRFDEENPNTFYLRHKPVADLSSCLRQPFYDWAFNKNIWRTCPNLIPREYVTEYVALYYLQFIHTNFSYGYQNSVFDTIWSDTDNSVFEQVRLSLLSFVQAAARKQISKTASDLLAPGLILGLSEVARPVILSDLKAASILASKFENPKMLTPIENSTRMLMTGSSVYIKTLTSQSKEYLDNCSSVQEVCAHIAQCIASNLKIRAKVNCDILKTGYIAFLGEAISNLLIEDDLNFKLVLISHPDSATSVIHGVIVDKDFTIYRDSNTGCQEPLLTNKKYFLNGEFVGEVCYEKDLLDFYYDYLTISEAV